MYEITTALRQQLNILEENHKFEMTQKDETIAQFRQQVTLQMMTMMTSVLKIRDTFQLLSSQKVKIYFRVINTKIVFKC